MRRADVACSWCGLLILDQMRSRQARRAERVRIAAGAHWVPLRNVMKGGSVLQVANSWRTTAGLSDTGEPASWDSIVRGLDNNAGLGRFAGPGGWNNMDFLQVSAPQAWRCTAAHKAASQMLGVTCGVFKDLDVT